MVTSTHEESADRPRPARRLVAKSSRRPVTEAARERRRRELHFRRRRRDLIVDLAAALAIALVVLVMLAPGLGVIALVGVPLAAIGVALRVRSALKRRRASDSTAPPPGGR